MEKQIYQLIRSQRKTLAISISPKGEVTVRAPYRASAAEIDAFVESHRQWIEKHIRQVQQKNETMQSITPMTMAEAQALAKQAASYIPSRVAIFARKMNISYGRITIRMQKSKWGSCTAAGNLNFNCLLMLAPPEVLDSVIVHELCHRQEMNHSDRFYHLVYRYFPEYDRWHSWLKKNGGALMARRPPELG